MLTRFHKILIGALVIQLALAIVLLSRSDESGVAKRTPLLAGFDAAKVTKLVVHTKEAAAPVELTKRGDAWVVSSSYDYPVASSKVEGLLSSITKLSSSAPMATQATRHKQLLVDDAEFVRKLVLSANGKDTTLFVGGPAGPRRTALRILGDARVFAVGGLDASAISGAARDWIDASYVKIPKEQVTKVTVQVGASATEVERDGTSWKINIGGAPLVLAAGETLAVEAIDQLVDHATTINLSMPADPNRNSSTPTATITIARKGAGDTSTAPAVLDVVLDGNNYWIRERGSPRAVLVDKAQLSDVIEVSREKLVTKPAPPAPAGSADKTGDGPRFPN